MSHLKINIHTVQYIHSYTYIHVYTYSTYLHTYIHTYTHTVYMYIHSYIHPPTHTHTHTYTHTHIHTVHTYIYTHVYIQAYIHSYMYNTCMHDWIRIHCMHAHTYCTEFYDRFSHVISKLLNVTKATLHSIQSADLQEPDKNKQNTILELVPPTASGPSKKKWISVQYQFSQYTVIYMFKLSLS